MTNGTLALRLPAEVDALAPAAAAWAALAGQTLPPLSNYLAALPDLTRRLAVLLHLVTAAGGDEGRPTREITLTTVKRALAIIDGFVLPAAWAVLGPVSIGTVERDARRLIPHLRALTSADHHTFERRPLMRAWQNSMDTPRFDAALRLLQEAELLVAIDKIDGRKVGGQHFEVAASVYAAV